MARLHTTPFRAGRAASGPILIEGLEELTATLRLLPKEALNIARNATHAVAGEVRKEIRNAAPSNSGTLRKAIVAKRNKIERGAVSSDVIVTTGRGARHDAFYWRFIEYGTVKLRAVPFVVPTIENMRALLPALFQKHFGLKLEKAMAKKAKALTNV
jgi:HK97 gp10 family phage protein